MTGISRFVANLPPEQQALRAKCFHPTGHFAEWKTEEVEKSLAERFAPLLEHDDPMIAAILAADLYD